MADQDIVFLAVAPNPVVVFGDRAGPDLVFTDLVQHPDVVFRDPEALVVALEPVLKGDKGDPGPPGRDASVPDVLAALAAEGTVTVRAVGGAVLMTLYGRQGS